MWKSGNLLIISMAVAVLLMPATGCSSEARQEPRRGEAGKTPATQSAAASEQSDTVSVYGYRIINSYPHDEGAFTQGLFFRDGFLFESTGLAGQSSLRKSVLQTGEIIMRHNIPQPYFGEGAVAVGERILSLTWKRGKGFIYGIEDLRVRGEFSYTGEGWGITYDGARLIMSDGTPQLRFLDPHSFEQTGSLTVTLRGKAIRNLNELEWVDSANDGEGAKLYANLWQTDWIAIIDPASGKVTGLVDMTGLLPEADIVRMRAITGKDNVLNGIAYDRAGGRLFVTGKNWPRLFEIELVLREIQ